MMSRFLTICSLLAVILITTPTFAQDDDTLNTIGFGQSETGTLTDANPVDTYVFDGQRGEALSLRLETTRGGLDPVLTVQDADGTLLVQQDDHDGTTGAVVESLRLTDSGRYTVTVGRFGYALGSTSGEYTLTLERIGVSSASGSALRYGDSVINNIDADNPQVYYTFQGLRGDVISLQMQRVSGNLDPYLQIVNADAVVIAENDDAENRDTLDAAITGHVLQEDGTYIIVASRFGQVAGDSTGSFVLSLDSRETSGIASSTDTAFPLLSGETVQAVLNDEVPTRYYTFRARQDDIVTVSMTRVNGTLDAFLVLADPNLIELVSDDDSGGGQNARISQFIVPRDDTYYIVASRYEGAEGRTEGTFDLAFQIEGNAFDDVDPAAIRLQFGTTVIGSLNDAAPQTLYAFRAEAGQDVTISLVRIEGDIDANLALFNANFQRITGDDGSGGSENARIDRFDVPETGLYYILVSRSGGDAAATTTGSYTLVLAQRFD